MAENVQTATVETVVEKARAGREQALQELVELLSFPSVSAESRHHPDVKRAADWVAQKLRSIGMDVEVDTQFGLPVIAAQWMGRPGKPTLAIYGHYDVQPPDPLDEWKTPPFEASIRDGYIYARGATDDKGQLLAGIKAVEYAFAAGGPPINIRFLIEGEEESGGTALSEFVTKNAERLKTDYLFVADGMFAAKGLPKLDTVLRGIVSTEIEVRGPQVDLHSGMFGGVAPNPFNSLAHILSGLKGPDGHINIPGFYDKVKDPSAQELEDWGKLPVTDKTYLEQIGSLALEGEQKYSVHERLGSRPTLDVHGIIGGFIGEGSKTVIPAKAIAKVSMRLVPDQDPNEVFKQFEAYVKELATPGVTVSVRPFGINPPVVLGTDHEGIRAAKAAFKAAFGSEPVFTREGGSVPVVYEFQQALDPDIICSGFGLPTDALHSPNENFAVEHYHGGTEMVIHLMHELASA